MLQSMGSQRVGHDLMCEQQWRRLKDRGEGAGCHVSGGGMTKGSRAQRGHSACSHPFTPEDTEAGEGSHLPRTQDTAVRAINVP